MNKIKKLSIVFDMHGCPNRCKHCWIGHMNNKQMNNDDLIFVANFFNNVCDNFEIYSWMREPDYADNYKDLWVLENKLAKGIKPQKFELASFYRLVRDKDYAPWLYEIGVRTVQLTLFGLEKMTDYFVGRSGAFKEILQATEILLENKIAPRWQVFINKMNKDEIIDVINLSKELKLAERTKAINQQFKLFVHEGSCDGENKKLYPIRITRDDIDKKIIPYYLNYHELEEEKILYKKFINLHSTRNLVDENIVLYVTNDFSVYPNISNITSWWKIGNIKDNKVEEIIDNYQNNKAFAMHISNTIPISQLVKKCGDEKSDKLFSIDDYLDYLLNKYCEDEYNV